MTSKGQGKGRTGALRRVELTVRERTLLGAGGATLLGMAMLVVGYFIWDGLSSLKERNQQMRQALSDVRSLGEAYRAHEQEREALDRKVHAPPSLLGYLEQAAQEAGISIPESTERQPVTRGDYQEHAVDVKLRGVALSPLVQFLEKVEGGAFLVITSQLSLRTRYGQREQMDVEATFSTYTKPENGKTLPTNAGGKP